MYAEALRILIRCGWWSDRWNRWGCLIRVRLVWCKSGSILGNGPWSMLKKLSLSREGDILWRGPTLGSDICAIVGKRELKRRSQTYWFDASWAIQRRWSSFTAAHLAVAIRFSVREGRASLSNRLQMPLPWQAPVPTSNSNTVKYTSFQQSFGC